MNIDLFIPCIVDQFFPQVGINTYKILKKVGCNVDYPFEQTCCGQPAFNTGYRKDAEYLAKKFINIFSKSDYVIAPSGSCVSMVKIFYDRLELPSDYQSKLAELKGKIFELSEFLVDILKISDVGAKFSGKITYHESCHLLRKLKIARQPRILINNVKGVEFVELNESDRCCGFGGTFSVKFPELSTVLTSDKIKNIEESGAQYVVANDSSCLMNVEGVLRRKGSNIRTMHIADLLASGI
ncbi:MAG: (Fe-S)-binding protein [Bacteroidetes bacterium]|nr:(Fe-S)-binding protein [Bacteroidota bacterium]MBU1422608.1 (Fe-S)-binding protein [Bacteroidota bacterium]MBU2635758.1 (Fe-S)-binding protein [Bacteroidota bacterium]